MSDKHDWHLHVGGCFWVFVLCGTIWTGSCAGCFDGAALGPVVVEYIEAKAANENSK
jgi:hypothetical protein